MSFHSVWINEHGIFSLNRQLHYNQRNFKKLSTDDSVIIWQQRIIFIDSYFNKSCRINIETVC